jgi:hypothetical protein
LVQSGGQMTFLIADAAFGASTLLIGVAGVSM